MVHAFLIQSSIYNRLEISLRLFLKHCLTHQCGQHYHKRQITMHGRVLLINKVSVFKYLFIHIYLYLYLVIFIFSFTFTRVITYKMICYNSVTKSKIVQDFIKHVLIISHPEFCTQSGYLLALLFAF